MEELDKILAKNLGQIKLVITDVDGVLTDGGLYYTSDGLFMKRFNVKDGMGVVLLKQAGILCGIISSDDSEIIKVRAEKLKMDFAFTGVLNKKEIMLELCAKENINPSEAAFIGDDVNDLEIISSVGLSAAPSDAIDKVKNLVDYICTKNGGQGAFREFADLILKAKASK
ncbi:MAG: HAD-IIIA family hydrolase [Bacteroidota bacterium]